MEESKREKEKQGLREMGTERQRRPGHRHRDRATKRDADIVRGRDKETEKETEPQRDIRVVSQARSPGGSPGTEA